MKLIREDSPEDEEALQALLNDIIAADPTIRRIRERKNAAIQARLNVLKKKAWREWESIQRKEFKRRAAKLGAPVQPQEMGRVRRFV